MTQVILKNGNRMNRANGQPVCREVQICIEIFPLLAGRYQVSMLQILINLWKRWGVVKEGEENPPNVENQPNVENLRKEKLPKEERIRKPEEDVVK